MARRDWTRDEIAPIVGRLRRWIDPDGEDLFLESYGPESVNFYSTEKSSDQLRSLALNFRGTFSEPIVVEKIPVAGGAIRVRAPRDDDERAEVVGWLVAYAARIEPADRSRRANELVSGAVELWGRLF